MPHSIRTKRLILRPLTIRDAPGLYEMANDFGVVSMTATWGWPITEPYVLSRIESAAARARDGAPIFAIILADGSRQTGPVFVGTIGGVALHGQRAGAAGVGYMLARRHWGRGFAVEALRAWCAHMFRTTRAGSIVGERWIDNPASGRVMEKAGFVAEGPVPPAWCEARNTMLPGVRYRLARA